MTTAATRMAEITQVEGFDVIFKRNGTPISSSEHGLPSYRSRYERKLSGDKTVNEWITRRFKHLYPDLDGAVLMNNGEEAHGNMKLETVRDAYSDL